MKSEINATGLVFTLIYEPFPSSRKSLLLALCIKDEAKRKSFLERACARNPVMRAEIEALLAMQADAEEFFAECFPQSHDGDQPSYLRH